MPTLAELRAQSGPKPLPRATQTVTLIEGQHLLARSQELEEEHLDLLVQADRQQKAKDQGQQEPLKAGQKPESLEPRLEAIKVEAREIAEKLAEFQSDLGLKGMTGGDWQRYKDAHPPREDNKADERLAGNLCNSSDLFADLGRFVATWEGEDLTAADWDGWLAERICYADRRDLVTAVVDLHETRLPRSPKLQSSASSTGASESD